MIGKTLFVAAIAITGPAQAQRVRLDDAAIRAALVGNLITYSPPGWYDAGAHEEFPTDGTWRGIRYSFGPIDFSGLWEIKGGQLCVSDIHGLWETMGAPAELCRSLWRDVHTGALWMDHIAIGFDGLGGGRTSTYGLQLLKVRSLASVGID